MLVHTCPHGGSGSITCKVKMKERSKTTHASTEGKNVCVHVSTQDLWGRARVGLEEDSHCQRFTTG